MHIFKSSCVQLHLLLFAGWNKSVQGHKKSPVTKNPWVWIEKSLPLSIISCSRYFGNNLIKEACMADFFVVQLSPTLTLEAALIFYDPQMFGYSLIIKRRELKNARLDRQSKRAWIPNWLLLKICFAQAKNQVIF